LKSTTTHRVTSCEDYGISTFTLYFYSDPAGTVPLSVTDFPVRVMHMVFAGPGGGSGPFYVIGNGYTAIVAQDVYTSYTNGCGSSNQTMPQLHGYNIFSSDQDVFVVVQ